MPTEGQRSRAPGSRRAELQISQEYAVFDNVLETMEEYLTADTGGNATRLGIATEVVTDLTTYQTDWNTKYATYKDPATHTPAAVEAVRVAYKTGQEKVRSIQRQVKNAAVEKTADDYKSLSIHIDKETKTRVPRPTEAPSIVETHRAIGSNKFLVQVSSGEGQAHNRLPLANHIRYRVAHQTPGAEPPTDGDYTGIHESGRAEFTVPAPPNTPKGTVGYIKACFVNRRGEAGPECPPYEYVIN